MFILYQNLNIAETLRINQVPRIPSRQLHPIQGVNNLEEWNGMLCAIERCQSFGASRCMGHGISGNTEH